MKRRDPRSAVSSPMAAGRRRGLHASVPNARCSHLGDEIHMNYDPEAIRTTYDEVAEREDSYENTVAELTRLLENAGCEILEMASTPTLVDSWDQSTYPEELQSELMGLELKVCTIPELLGTGHHLFCVARKT
jgi:hypothetical protein